jgi:hypothetical protein
VGTVDLDEAHDLRCKRSRIAEHRQVIPAQCDAARVRAVLPDFVGTALRHDLIRVIGHAQERLPAAGQVFAHICPERGARPGSQAASGDM